jgi:hypothetical protein
MHATRLLSLVIASVMLTLTVTVNPLLFERQLSTCGC